MTLACSQRLIGPAPRPGGVREALLRPVPLPEGLWGDQLDESLFTLPVYLRAHGYSDVQSVHMPVLGDGGRALFSQSGQRLNFLDRVTDLTPAGVDVIADAAFEVADAHFIVFRDVQLREDGSRITWPHLAYNYQANWWRAIGPDEIYVSNRRAKKLRQLSRALAKQLGAELEFVFERTQAEDIGAIGDFNKTNIERQGGRYQMSAHQRDALRRIAGQVGYTASLRVSGRLIAGSIYCIAGPNAYAMIMGYDVEFTKYSQGLHCMLLGMGELQGIACTNINFLWGDSPYKANLGAVRRPLTTFIVCRDWRSFLDPALLKAAFPHAKLKLKRRIKAAIKRVRT